MAKQSRSNAQSQVVKQIERLDRQLLKLCQDRAKLVQKLGKEGVHPRQVLVTPDQPAFTEQLAGLSKGPLPPLSVTAIMREVHSGCLSLIKRSRVAYLGPQFSYSHLAAVERFGGSAELAPVATIAAVFEELTRGHVEFGIVPLENSTDGRIADTLTMFARRPVRICGEVQLHIHHQLLARCGREEIHEVYSKPQALSQCRDWLSKHLPWARQVELTSTAAAAQLAVDKAGAAAIASRQAGANYGLDIVAENIEDNRHNITRFAVIGGEPAARTGRDKTALMFEIAHRPGSLADVMAVFKRGRLNLTWIESFPMSGSNSEYLFFVELEGHQDDPKVRNALTALARRTKRLETLGSYARATPIG